MRLIRLLIARLFLRLAVLFAMTGNSLIIGRPLHPIDRIAIGLALALLVFLLARDRPAA